MLIVAVGLNAYITQYSPFFQESIAVLPSIRRKNIKCWQNSSCMLIEAVGLNAYITKYSPFFFKNL